MDGAVLGAGGAVRRKSNLLIPLQWRWVAEVVLWGVVWRWRCRGGAVLWVDGEWMGRL